MRSFCSVTNLRIQAETLSRSLHHLLTQRSSVSLGRDAITLPSTYVRVPFFCLEYFELSSHSPNFCSTSFRSVFRLLHITQLPETGRTRRKPRPIALIGAGIDYPHSPPPPSGRGTIGRKRSIHPSRPVSSSARRSCRAPPAFGVFLSSLLSSRPSCTYVKHSPILLIPSQYTSPCPFPWAPSFPFAKVWMSHPYKSCSDSCHDTWFCRS